MRQVISSFFRSAEGWREASPCQTHEDLWVVPEWVGKPELGPWLAPNGQRVVDEIGEGRAGDLPFPVWFKQSPNCSGERRGDLLWTVGLPMGLVSDRFIDALDALNVAGWSTYDVDIRDRDGHAILGYSGFVADVSGTSEVVSRAWKKRLQMPVYLVTERVVRGLHDAGVVDLRIESVSNSRNVPRSTKASSRWHFRAEPQRSTGSPPVT